MFMIGYCTSFDESKPGGNPLNLSDDFMRGLVKTGLTGALPTIVIAQLISQTLDTASTGKACGPGTHTDKVLCVPSVPPLKRDIYVWSVAHARLDL